MKTFGVSRGKALTGLIGAVDRGEYESGAPGFAAIIVRKDTGFPGGGYFYGDDVPVRLRRPANRRADPRLSETEREYVERQQRAVWAYYRRHSTKTDQ
jgi:hypothetical protein